MSDKSKVSRSRHKRTQEKTRQARRRDPLITSQLVLCYCLLLVALLFTLNLGRSVVLTELTPGQLAPSTVQALEDFETVDLDATELKRERAAAAVPTVLEIRTRELGEARDTLESFLSQLSSHLRIRSANDTEAGAGPTPGPMAFREVVDLLGLDPELADMPKAFDLETVDKLEPLALERLNHVWSRGILSKEARETSLQGMVPKNRVRLGRDGPVRDLEEIPTPAEAAEQAADHLGERLELTRDRRDLLFHLFKGLLRPNLLVDTMAHREARQEEMDDVAPVTVVRRRDTTLMEARTPITEQTIQDLKAHERKMLEMEEGRNNLARICGQGLYLAVGLAISLAFLYLLENPSFRKTNRLFLWVVLTEGSLLLGQFLIFLSADLNLFPGHFLSALLPLALAPMLGTILYGPRLGLAVGLSSSLAHALQHDMSLTIFFTGLSLAMTAALSVRAIHRRSNLFRAGFWIGGVKALIIIGAGSLELVPWAIVLQQGMMAFASGLFSALLVLLLISPFEYLFKVTTDIRLLELSDMSHPLLSRLAMEAPGTYHHSLMVAHLAQAAAREIRVNDMLVRVCAYYHDIGKLTKPEFFIENNQGRQNPHDDLSPSMSRLLIISHVKEGVSLARRYKLPAVIVDGIEQHHGTSVIQFFYHRARSQAGESDKTQIKAEDYRYPGPRPVNAEMGILLMADSIEAASRTIDKNKPGQIEGLVNEIIREKLNDGQLDHSNLTMAQISAVRRSFIFSLNNMLHGRVAYPKDGEEEKEGKKESKPAREAKPVTHPLEEKSDTARIEKET